MFPHYFYHALIKKYVIVFGSMFNNISVERTDAEDDTLQEYKVPVTYGPKQKFIARLASLETATDSTKQPVAMILPRITFEIGAVRYDNTRRLQKTLKYVITNTEDHIQSYAYTPAPYLIDFKMAIMVKNAEDGTKIIEQILPFFSPDYTVTLNLIPALGIAGKIDVPIVLNNANATDTYAEGKVDQRRAIIWDLNFTMKATFFGPVKDGAKPIKMIDINLYVPPTASDPATEPYDPTKRVADLNIRPGLTANGEPTTNIDDTIPYQEIEQEDNWDFIESVNEYL